MKQIKSSLIPIKTLPTGDSLSIKTFKLKGDQEGPQVYIQANVHGAEIQGNAVIYELLNFFINHKFIGELIFVPCANPMGLNNKAGTFTQGRFNPVTGDNWNRNYTDLLTLPKEKINFDLSSFAKKFRESSLDTIKKEFKAELEKAYTAYWDNICQEKGPNENNFLNITLQKLASTSDIVIDLHTGPKATRYLYAAEFEKESAKNFLTPFFLVIPNKFAGAMDEACFMPWLHLEAALKDLGREVSLGFESYTLELGSEETISSKEAKADAARIIHYLNTMGLNIENPPQIDQPEQNFCLLKNLKTYYSPYAGLVEYLKTPGSTFKKGEPLAKVLNFREVNESKDMEKAWKNIFALDSGYIITHSTTGVIHEGHEIFQVMTNSENP